MRHFAIYGSPWPQRLPPLGQVPVYPAQPISSRVSTPREESTPDGVTRKVTHKGLSILDQKLAAAAASRGGAKNKHDQVDVEGRPSKRRRTDSELSGEASHATDWRNGDVDMEANTRQIPGGGGEEVRRKRGRPPHVKLEEVPTDLSTSGVHSGSRKRRNNEPSNSSSAKNTNGTTRSLTISLRTSIRNKNRTSGSAQTGVSQREADIPTIEQTDTHSQIGTVGGNMDEEEELQPLQKVVPRPISSFSGSKLFWKPTPLSFAIKAWASPVVMDESLSSSSSSEDEKAPVTPEDGVSPPPLSPLVNEEDEDEDPTRKRAKPSTPVSLRRGPLNLKPSPWAFARRRWTSQPASRLGVDLGEDHSDHGADEEEQEGWNEQTEMVSRLAIHRYPAMPSHP